MEKTDTEYMTEFADILLREKAELKRLLRESKRLLIISTPTINPDNEKHMAIYDFIHGELKDF